MHLHAMDPLLLNLLLMINPPTTLSMAEPVTMTRS